MIDMPTMGFSSPVSSGRRPGEGAGPSGSKTRVSAIVSLSGTLNEGETGNSAMMIIDAGDNFLFYISGCHLSPGKSFYGDIFTMFQCKNRGSRVGGGWEMP